MLQPEGARPLRAMDKSDTRRCTGGEVGCQDEGARNQPGDVGGSHIVGIMRVAKDGVIHITTTQKEKENVTLEVGRSENKGTGCEAHGCSSQRASERARDSQEIWSKDVASAPDTRALPWAHLVIVMLSVASDAFALTGPLPFLPQLCVAQYGLAEADVGYYVGLFTGAYPLAKFCTSWMIGHLSDEYGRKFFTLLGLFVSASLTIALGVTTNVWAGIALRLLAGALNANVAIARAQVADLVPNGARAMPYAYLGATFALARTFSSGVAGLSVGLFWVQEFGVYMAPCVMLGIPAAFTFLMALIFLPETHANRRYKTVAEAGLHCSRFASNTVARVAGWKELERPPSTQTVKGLTFSAKWKLITKDSLLCRLIIANGLISFANGFFFPGFVLFLSSSRDRHGMGFSELNTGVAFTALGAVGFAFQVLLYKPLLKCMGLRNLLKMGLGGMMVGSAMVPCSELFLVHMSPVDTPVRGGAEVTEVPELVLTLPVPLGADGSESQLAGAEYWLVLAPCVFFMGAGLMLCLPVLTTLVSNATLPEIQGMTQGMTQSIASLLRAFGPFAVGILFSVTYAGHGPAIIFGLLALVYALTLHLTYCLPARVEETGWSPRPCPPWLASIFLCARSRSPHLEGAASLICRGESGEGAGGTRYPS